MVTFTAGAIAIAWVLTAPVVPALCPTPIASVSADRVEPGASIVVTGVGWGTCQDPTGSTGGAADPTLPPPEPYRGIRLILVQDDRQWPLATVDASGAPSRFSVTVQIPAAAHDGSAELQAVHQAHTATVALHVSSSEGTHRAELARTGWRPTAGAVLAVAMLTLGISLVMAGGRETSAELTCNKPNN